MGKSAPKIQDPLKSLQRTAFPGLTTDAFSLTRRTTPSRPASRSLSRSPASRGGGSEFQNRTRTLKFLNSIGAGGPDVLDNLPLIQSTLGTARRSPSVAQSQQGPFVLRRTDPFVPQTEQRLFNALGTNRIGILSNLAAIGSARDRLGASRGTISGLFGETANLRGDLDRLAGEVTPGFGRLTQAAQRTARNAFTRQVGDLRSALQKRGLQGSQFAINEEARAGLDLAETEFQLESQAFVQELDLRRQIVEDAGKLIELDQQTLGVEAQNVALQLGLNEQQAQVFKDELLNIQSQGALLAQRTTRELQELGIAGSLINQQQAIVADLAKAQAQLAAQAAADQGSFIGGLLRTAVGAASLFV